MIFVNANRVLIVRFSSLGDILLATPLIRTLKKKYPNLQIDFLLKEEYFDLLKHNPYLNNIYKLKNNEITNIQSLKNNNYDFIIDLQNNFRSASIRKKLNGTKFYYEKNNFLKFLLVNFKINLLKNSLYVPERYANSIPGFSLDEKGLDIYVPDEIKSSLEPGKKYIAFAPGSRHYTKMWKEEYFIKLGNMLQKENFTVVLLGGESDKIICKRISSAILGSINLANDNNLLKLCADLKMCSALVCNDSGLMHVGSALQIPLVTIFGSTVKEFGFTPYKCNNILLENNELKCRPCSHIGKSSCPKKHFLCMNSITPETVFNSLMEIINSK